MSEFKEAPVLVLSTMEEVRAALSEPRHAPFGFSDLRQYRIKALWLIELIDEIAAGGQYPYNATVKALAESRLGLPPKSHAEYAREGDTLSLLIYNAQSYRRSDQLRAEGFEPFTQEVLERAFALGKKLELPGDQGRKQPPLRVRKINGKLYAMRPRKRSQHYPPRGQPIRFADRREQQAEAPQASSHTPQFPT